ncbi:hypothetical protein WDJ51_03550 [Rathayibacter sp. YIM 133350]|uniref:hypothetical protein n=1 Tax=Rathayibacter sp. YIM 133350 TaxID=3131992 RepID=UPI00307DD846
MRGRIASSVVVAAAILVGTAGCNLVAPQTTTEHYFASDGVSTSAGALDVRNAVIIAPDGTEGNLVMTVVNPTEKQSVLRIQYEASDGTKTDDAVLAPASSTTSIGGEGDQTVTLTDIDAKPGSLFPVFFTAGDSEGKQVLVPVLNAGLPEYSTLAPSSSSAN